MRSFIATLVNVLLFVVSNALLMLPCLLEGGRTEAIVTVSIMAGASLLSAVLALGILKMEKKSVADMLDYGLNCYFCLSLLITAAFVLIGLQRGELVSLLIAGLPVIFGFSSAALVCAIAASFITKQFCSSS